MSPQTKGRMLTPYQNLRKKVTNRRKQMKTEGKTFEERKEYGRATRQSLIALRQIDQAMLKLKKKQNNNKKV